MGLFDALRGRRRVGSTRSQRARDHTRDIAHLEAWTTTHRGVEAYVEPRTTVTETTVALVAYDGEWTRRRVSGPDAAYAFGRRLGIPVYDVAKVGYPRRMRQYTARLTAERKRTAMD